MNEGVSGGDQALAFIYLLGCLILVMSGLAVRRAPIGQTLKMVLAWILIFAAGFAIFALREDFTALGRRIAAAAWGSDSAQQSQDGELRIAMAEDGHFWVNGELNGQPVRFLVDSGATVTTISAETAARVGIRTTGRAVRVETANGDVLVDQAHADTLKLGPIERSDVGVAVARGETINVIGMNLLSTLSRWSVENRTLVLRP